VIFEKHLEIVPKTSISKLRSQLQNASFATSTELIGCARMKLDATLERTASLRAQTETGFSNYLCVP
jgi:hypothetical protein